MTDAEALLALADEIEEQSEPIMLDILLTMSDRNLIIAALRQAAGVSQPDEVQTSDAVKLTYIKRWRTIVPLPGKYADEIAEALRPSEPEVFQYRFQDDDGKWNGWFVCEKEQYDRVCRNGKIGYCKAEARPLYATSQSAPVAQAVPDPLRAAAERVCWFDWSDNDMDACAAMDALRKALTMPSASSGSAAE